MRLCARPICFYRLAAFSLFNRLCLKLWASVLSQKFLAIWW
jgi:hypothetical protein